jgi:hypothetical protein
LSRFQSVQIQTNKILARIPGREFSAAIGVKGSICIAIFPVILNPDANSIPLSTMGRWRSTMRELSAEARLHLYARSLSRRTGTGFHAAALYGAFALIAAVIFGTLSVHPF